VKNFKTYNSCQNENYFNRPHTDPLLQGEGEKKFPFSSKEKGLGDEVNLGNLGNIAIIELISN